MGNFVALCSELIEDGRVEVYDINLNLLFVNSAYVVGGLAPRPEEVVKDGNYVKREEPYRKQVYQVFDTIEFKWDTTKPLGGEGTSFIQNGIVRQH